MNAKLTRWSAVAALAIAGAVPLVMPAVLPKVHGQDRAPALASAASGVDQLKTQAFAALFVGNFDRGNDLLAKAAAESKDPTLGQMHQWTATFEAQLQKFAGERHTAYTKALADTQLLLKDGHPDAALDLANRAQTLSDDKAGFHQLPWLKQLVAESTARAAGYEQQDQWLNAMRIYEDLGGIEPASVEWKEKLKGVTRRVRLLSSYAPDTAKAELVKYIADRDAIEALLLATASTTKPTTGPTTMPMAATPATKPAVDPLADAFKTDWHETLKGVELQQLTRAIDDIYTNYYRDVTYKQLLLGGLDGVQALMSTPGLQASFPGLADPAKKAAYQQFLDGWRTAARNATADNEEQLIEQFLSADDADGMLKASGRTVGIPDAVLISEFADGARSGLDPFTDVIWPSSEAEFRKSTQGEFSGVGIQIEVDPNTGDLKVVEPLPDSPAEQAGVIGEDVIVRVDGKPIHNITTDGAVKLITGPTGTMVRLTLRSPDGKLRDVNLRRQRIKVASVKGYTETGLGQWNYYVDPDSRIAYIRILSFTAGTPDELRAVIESLGSRCNGIILDLRGNPGGLLPSAIKVCDTFLKSGVIVSTHPDRDTQSLPFQARAHNEGDEFTKPLVVLVNQYSASASEIVSGALKDDHRAILVGERTYGKGSVQQLFPLPPDDDCTIKLTTSHYYLPSGRCIHREENSTTWGVDPDVTVELTPEQMQATLIARHKMDVYHAVTADPAGGGAAKLNQMAPAVTAAQQAAAPTTGPSTQPALVTKPSDLLAVDPQLSAAVLVMKLELAGAKL